MEELQADEPALSDRVSMQTQRTPSTLFDFISGNVNFYVPSFIQLCFLSLKVFEEQLVLSLDEDEDDLDIIDYSSVSGESFPSICQRASILLQLSWGLMPVE